MADLPADLLIVRHADDTTTTYEDVRYCLWRDGVTVYQHGEEIHHGDVVEVRAERAAVPA
ncbi:hypothetical protein FHR83_006770 [Actinoplanes campanulatus]|uniref:Uncharacterized protein n=1 Tax=Actinoplanes campanulatus TaxID=113559 RepID=A0A7W5ANG9_9ACTN|nr:hypothetical protein [Actinoplanes campanulatus]MBB3099064.1 hypothetical protein [Actinoplanes campanulatus]GGN39207.1 hypothetical protein GCM10010109_66880 [Actinoplanes campanulatus]GID40221.1 hypothetical protein Aca09nite_67270 [Actinoplanes campanulatus]